MLISSFGRSGGHVGIKVLPRPMVRNDRSLRLNRGHDIGIKNALGLNGDIPNLLAAQLPGTPNW